MGLAQQKSSRAFEVSSRYHFTYYQLSNTAARHTDHPKNWSIECCQMHKWLPQLLPWQEADLVYPTTNHPCSPECILGEFPRLQGTPVQNRGVPEIGDAANGTVKIWTYRCSMMFQWFLNDLKSNCHHWAQYRVEGQGFTVHLLIGMIWLWHCPVHTSDEICAQFSLQAKWSSLLQVVCWPKWMPWIRLIGVLAMLVIQSSCFAICFSRQNFHSNYLTLSPCCCWSRSICQSRLLGVYSIFIGSTFSWWGTWYIV